MTDNIDMDKPRTGVPNDAFKSGWDRIFGKKPEPRLCGSCGINLEKAKCRACREALGEIPKHDMKSKTGDW